MTDNVFSQKLKLRYELKRAYLELKVSQGPIIYDLGTVIPTESIVYAALNTDEELCTKQEKLNDVDQKSRTERIYGCCFQGVVNKKQWK
jgi:hypothetical protein